MVSKQSDSLGRAIVSDDDEFFCFAIGHLLRDRNGFSEVIETRSLNEAIEQLVCSTNFEVGLFDLNTKGTSNWSDLVTIRATCPRMRLIVVSESRDHDDIINALRAGVHGFINKDQGISELSSAVKSVCNGQVYVPPFLPEEVCRSNPATVRSGTVIPHPKSPNALAEVPTGKRLGAAKSDQTLYWTPRQRELIDLLIAGHSNKSMARELGLSEGAIKFHMSAILRSLGVSNRVEAATRAMTYLSLADAH